ncbi:MAG TPA: Asp-tRNA(Asn)/Glu-tRNA(Gln) amidotransferase subunit GatC [Acidimicrobiia bacterium]
MSEPISREEAEHVASLARLRLSDDELDRLTGELGEILEHVSELAALDLDGVEPTAHPLPLVNVLRADEVRPSLDRAEVLAQAPSVEGDRFRVPRILDAP